MFVPRAALRISMVAAVIAAVTSAFGQANDPPSPATEPPLAPGLVQLDGDDAKRAQELDRASEEALKAGRWDEAIAMRRELVALRIRVQGAEHFESVSAIWGLRALEGVASRPAADRSDYINAVSMEERASPLSSKGQYAEARPLLEKALATRRRLQGDDHPDTAMAYNNLAMNLVRQGKYAEAGPLVEKALAIHRRLQGDDHPDTAIA